MIYTGTYFGTHFIMGGERFDTPQPEAYLFGENGDLNFLGSRPTAVSTFHIKIDFILIVIDSNNDSITHFSFHIRRRKRTNQRKH